MKIKINGLVMEVQEGDSLDIETKDDFCDGISEIIEHRRQTGKPGISDFGHYPSLVETYTWHEEDGWKVTAK